MNALLRCSLTGLILAAGAAHGMASDGEDGLHFLRHNINTDSAFSACAAIDVDGDGRLDIVCGGWWYQAPDWKKHFVQEVEVIRGRYDGYSHLPYDVNGDGWTDLINVNYRSQSIFWVEHPGKALGSGEPWKKHVIAIPGAMETGRLADVDADGALDILPNGTTFAAWWQFARVKQPDGKIRRRFVQRDLPVEVAGHGVGFGDVDGDGRGDIIGPRGFLSAPEDRFKGDWKWNEGPELDRDSSIPILVVDADGDGDNDIIWGRGHNYGIYWMERDGDQWKRHTIDETWSQAHSLLWRDLDGDGRAELIAGKRFMAHDGKDPGAYDPLIVCYYKFVPKTRTWTRHVIASGDGVGFGMDPQAVDMDGDGDLDLVCPGRSGLYLLENLLDAGR